MGNERVIPSSQAKTVATFTLLSGGTEVSKRFEVLSITVNKEANRLPAATIIFLDGEPSRQTFAISNQPDFAPGKEIEIKLGYRGDEQTVFKGLVIKQSIKIRKQAAVLVVECRDKAVKMTGAVRSQYFLDKSDSDIIEELIERHGLEKDVETTSFQHKQIVQYNCTDWDFMLCRCDVNGLLCLAENGKVTVTKPAFAADSILTVQYGATVYDLDAEIDARLQYKTVKGTTWNHSDGELLDSVEANEPQLPAVGNLSPGDLSGVLNEDDYRLYAGSRMEEPELQTLVNARLLKDRMAKVRGSVRTDGTAGVSPGKFIQLNGIGERFEGKLFVTGVRHEVEKGNWQTVMQFGADPAWFAQTYNVQQPLAGARLPAAQGLQIGVVTALENDPAGDGRIQVKLPVHFGDEGVWCRVSTLDAGKNRGSFFLPEIDDEVVVGFLNNDPSQPIVLGMLNSGAKPPPVEAKDTNHIKGFVTRSEMKVLFDDEKKTVGIETPAGNKFFLSEEDKKIELQDQHGNKVTMDDKGITLDSVKDIVLKAATDIKAEGVNVSAKASAQAKLEGGSGAELSSGGATKVQGSIVNIN